MEPEATARRERLPPDGAAGAPEPPAGAPEVAARGALAAAAEVAGAAGAGTGAAAAGAGATAWACTASGAQTSVHTRSRTQERALHVGTGVTRATVAVHLWGQQEIVRGIWPLPDPRAPW